MMRRVGKTALITGAARGIGRGVTCADLRGGAHQASVDPNFAKRHRDLPRPRTSGCRSFLAQIWADAASNRTGILRLPATAGAVCIAGQRDHVDGGQWMS